MISVSVCFPRAVPLWVQGRGKLYPQMGFSLACASLGVPMEKVRVSDTEVVIPRTIEPDIVLPVRTYRSLKLNRKVGMLMDIPWFGSSDWETMYDWPNYDRRAQHLPALKVWDVVRDRKIAVHNNQLAD